MTNVIDGKAFAAKVCDAVASGTTSVKQNYDFTPGLAVVLVGDDAASEVYVRNKKRKTTEVGMVSFAHHLPSDTPQEALLALVESLNNNSQVHGILVQLPLPDHIDEHVIINAIDAGKHAVVIGRSNIVGKPMAQLLLNESCTITVCHSKTKDIAAIARQADILVAAAGRPGFVKADWVKEGATVIDVGINRVELEDGKTKLVGDIDFDAVKDKAHAITPVPGGVGPMTIACLLRNTLQAACAQHDVAFPLK